MRVINVITGEKYQTTSGLSRLNLYSESTGICRSVEMSTNFKSIPGEKKVKVRRENREMIQNLVRSLLLEWTYYNRKEERVKIKF